MPGMLQASVDGLATVDGTAVGNFQTVTGGNANADTVPDRPPGQRFPSNIPAPPTVTNVVMSRTYDEARDGALVEQFGRRTGAAKAELGKVRRDGDGNRIGLSHTTGLLVRCDGPEGNTNDNSKATFEMEFAVDHPWT